MENEINVFEKLNFENEDEFEFLILKPTNIDHLDYNKEGYLNEVLKTVETEAIKCNKDNFFNNVSK